MLLAAAAKEFLRIRGGVARHTRSIDQCAEEPALQGNNETAPNSRRKLQSIRKGLRSQACHAWRPSSKYTMGHVARPLAQQLGMAKCFSRTINVLDNNQDWDGQNGV